MDKKPLRTIVYVDGFNLYYGQLKGTSHKWLDPVALFQRVLGPQNQITQIKYFTARVQPTVNEPSVNTRQDAYFRALGLWCPLVQLHFGHFLRHKIRMENASPPPATVAVWKNEEKGSDVNLALQVVNDAWLNSPPGMQERSTGQWYGLWHSNHGGKVIVQHDGNKVASWSSDSGYKPEPKSKNPEK